MMQDAALIKKIQVAAKEVLLDEKALRYKNHVKGLLEFIGGTAKRGEIKATSDLEVSRLKTRYKKDMQSASKCYWFRRSLIRRAKNIIPGY
ncbi:MAG: hypothetical protein V7696_19315 [Halioglobus sp.]